MRNSLLDSDETYTINYDKRTQFITVPAPSLAQY